MERLIVVLMVIWGCGGGQGGGEENGVQQCQESNPFAFLTYQKTSGECVEPYFATFTSIENGGRDRCADGIDVGPCRKTYTCVEPAHPDLLGTVTFIFVIDYSTFPVVATVEVRGDRDDGSQCKATYTVSE